MNNVRTRITRICFSDSSHRYPSYGDCYRTRKQHWKYLHQYYFQYIGHSRKTRPFRYQVFRKNTLAPNNSNNV